MNSTTRAFRRAAVDWNWALHWWTIAELRLRGIDRERVKRRWEKRQDRAWRKVLVHYYHLIDAGLDLPRPHFELYNLCVRRRAGKPKLGSFI